MDAVGPICFINGKRHELPKERAEVTLLEYLRECGLTGTKLGCGEGGCGACTVLVSSMDDNGGIVHKAVNACLFPLYAVESCHVITVEGLGNARDGLHPIQERLSKAHGSQCGFCTPGFVMSMYALVRSTKGNPSEHQIEECLAGNLCRCTGYRPILDAFKTFAAAPASKYTTETISGNPNSTAPKNGGDQEPQNCSNSGVKLCPTAGQPCTCAPTTGKCVDTDEVGLDENRMSPSEPIFPFELRKRKPLSLSLPGPHCSWFRPISLSEMLELKSKHPRAKLVVGNTEVGIELKFKHAGYPVLIAATHVPELNEITVGESGVRIGASVSLTQISQLCQKLVQTLPNHNISPFAAILGQLRWFAGHQIRNVASLGGNIVTGSPISDLNPLMIASDALFTVKGKHTVHREVPAREFFLGYRYVNLEPHEILVNIFIPFTQKYEYVKEFKQAHRREDDIAIVTAGMRVKLAPNCNSAWKIDEASIALGGVASKTITVDAVEGMLVGNVWDKATMQSTMDAMKLAVRVPANAPGGMSEFRTSLAASFLFKFFLHVSHCLALDAPEHFNDLPESYLSAVNGFDRPPCKGVQYFAESEANGAVVGKANRHMAADLQVSGEAQYTDDMGVAGCLHAALVLSSRPHARILSIDASEALKSEGVQGFFCHKDVPGGNDIGPVLHDEELFASEFVTCVGQVVGVVVANTQAQAQKASQLVRIDFEDLDAVLTIDEAIAAKSFLDYGGLLECGDVGKGFLACEHVLEGEATCGGQEHFYLECHAAVAVPVENDEFVMHASTQAPYKHTVTVAHVLGIPEHKIVCKTKRIGGGFGGKETRSVFVNAAIAVPAYHLRRPVKICLDRDEDMKATGHRHPFKSKYRIGFTSDGSIIAADVQLYSNAGNSLDLSASIMDRALLHSDSCYKIPNFRVKGHLCRTNTPSNTAFRGFGGPQGMLFTEMYVDRVAKYLGKRVEEVRSLNMYKEGDKTHFGQVLEGCQVPKCWEEVVQTSQFGDRVAAAQKFNEENRFRKRGLAVTPTKFGISFTSKFLNQGGALVHVYTDGSVLVTHGGVEMGQGLHTKVCQVVANAIMVPLDDVHIAETSTDKVPNASPTAASASSDLYGSAVLNACEHINARLAPYREKMPRATMREIAKAAYMDRVDLSAHGFYKTPDITGFGGNKPFNYFCYGAACSEVELDVLTGDWHLLRTDIVMDVGNPINPAIDIGQVEGGFVQGMGWLCLEELVWGEKRNPWLRKGHLHTAGPGTYKIPTANDIPIDFRVSLLKNAPNPRAVHSSKAVGEPPFNLAMSVFFALKEAVYAARGVEGWLDLEAPCTPEKLRLACATLEGDELGAVLP